MVNETFDESKDMIIFDPIETWKKPRSKAALTPCVNFSFRYSRKVCVSTLLLLLWRCRQSAKNEQETLWPETRRLVNPQKVYVDLSDKLYKVKSQLLEEMSMKALDLQ